MSGPSTPHVPHPLIPVPIAVSSSEFRAIQGWQFPSEPFYLRQVREMLLRDIPQLSVFHDCALWRYVDPLVGPSSVGFGSISVTNIYSALTGNQRHLYIPLLSANPQLKSYGYGKSIVEHLVAEATQLLDTFKQSGEDLWEAVFLDVYVKNEPACNLYTNKCGFRILNLTNPEPDPAENGEPYYVMARKLA